MVYRSGAQGALDVAEKHPDCFFPIYTDGTLLDDIRPARLARAGNLVAAISLEGWREPTNCRRRTGTLSQATEAMSRLRAVGALFGVSLTATPGNAEEILSDEFVDFCFEQRDAPLAISQQPYLRRQMLFRPYPEALRQPPEAEAEPDL